MQLRHLLGGITTTKVAAYCLLTFCFGLSFFSCSKKTEVEPGGDFVKFKVDGKAVSQADAKGKWDLQARFYGSETAGYRFQISLSTETGDAPSFNIQFNSSEKYVVDKEYASVGANAPNTYSYADLKVPTDDLIIKSKAITIPGGVTVYFTDITDDRVKGRFTVNANNIFDAKLPSITDGEFSAKRKDL